MRSRGEIIAAAQAATTAAVQRGALTEDRARHWVTRAEAGEDVAPVVDALAAILPPRPAAAMSHAPAGTDPVLFAANPLLSEMRRSKPALVAAAEQERPAPKLFGDKDLPPFTASGLPPEQLAQHPWPIRRLMAAAPTLKAAYDLADKYSGPGGAEMAHADHARGSANGSGNASYLDEFSQWLRGAPGPNVAPTAQGVSPVASAPPSQYTTEALHRELFGNQVTGPRKPPGVPRPG